MTAIVAGPIFSDAPSRPPFASGLFVAIFLFGLVSMHFYADLANEEGRSLALDQLMTLALAAGALFCVARVGLTSLILHPRAIIAIVFVWLAITSLGAPEVTVALRRLFVAWLFCLSASILLVLPRDSRHFAMLLALCVAIVLAMSYFGVAALPARAIHQIYDVGEPALAGDWRGVFEHKNIAAPAMVILVFFSLYLAATWSAPAGWTMVALAMIFLIQTNGKSALALLPLALAMASTLVRWPRLGALLFISVLLAFNGITVGSALSPAIHQFIEGLGVDATFTSRTDVWALAMNAIMERPLTGYGFDAFWRTEHLLQSSLASETWAVTASHAHNSYIEAMLDGGVPALALTVFWLVLLPLRDAAKAKRRTAEPHLTLLYLRIWAFALIVACLESNFFKPAGMMWFVLLVAVFGLRLQADADLTEDGPPRHA